MQKKESWIQNKLKTLGQKQDHEKDMTAFFYLCSIPLQRNDEKPVHVFITAVIQSCWSKTSVKSLQFIQILQQK